MVDSSLIAVIVGGLLTMGGGAVTGGVTLIVNAIQSKKDKEKRRVEKFEDLVTGVYEFDAWLDKKEQIQAFGKEGDVLVSPFAKLEAISAVHFPTFLKRMEDLSVVSRNYEAWMATAGHMRTTGKVAEMNTGLNAVYEPYVRRREELLEDLKKYAVENFK